MKIYLTNIDSAKLQFQSLKHALALFVRERKDGNIHCDLEILAESAAELSRLTDMLPPRILAHVLPTCDYKKMSESPFRDRDGKLTKAFRTASKKFRLKRGLSLNANLGFYSRQHILTRVLP